MPGPKTNEREGTRAVLRHVRVSPYKLREVVDAIRGKPVHEAADLLRFVERDAASIVGKLLGSAVANAANNDGLDPEELFVSACYVDEGPTAKRWRPRARGRAARIRKRSSHVTVIVSRLPEERLARLQARRRAENLAMRARRVEATRRARAETIEGTTRRERRHPEAFPAPETETAGTEEAPVAETTEVGASSEALEVPETEVAAIPDELSASADETPETAQTVPPAQEAPDAAGAQDAIDGEEEKDS
jgi:large subunit ribosomal protein L22